MKTVTMEMWEKAGDFEKAADPGDRVEEDVVQNFLDCVPPAVNCSDLVQVGEPYSHEFHPQKERFLPTFTTFKKVDGSWIYCGHCFYGESGGIK